MAENEVAPTSPQTTAPPKKKSSKGKCCLGCCGGSLVIFFLLILGTVLLFRNATQPTDLGIKSSPKDFENFMDKTGIKLGSAPEILCFTCPIKYKGERDIDMNMSEVEASAWFNAVNNRLGPVKDSQIKIEKDKVSLATTFTYEGASYPVFASGNLQMAGPKTVKITLYQAKLGNLSIPKDLIPQIEEALNSFVNQKFAEIPNFKIEELELKEGSARFKGTFPEEVSAF